MEQLKPYDSAENPTGVYVLLFSCREWSDVLALGRDYGLLGVISGCEALRLMKAAGGPISCWEGYTGGDRPDGWEPGEPLDARWIDANRLSGLAINITTDRRAAWRAPGEET